jgi:tRNA dimethylallyltransferase
MAVKPIAPLIVIAGPTASGKSSLAVELAQQFNGEIICADSRTIYRGMDIGTAKPSNADRALVPHWGLDLIDPGEYFSVADFKAFALQKIAEIRARGHVPFLVGGTGLYIDSVVFDYVFGPAVDESLREQLNSMTIQELYDYCNKNNVVLPENEKNKRYVIRAIESTGSPLDRRLTPIEDTIIVGIATDRDVLRERITERAEQLFEDGVVGEAKKLGDKYGWNSEAMTSNIYPLVHKYVQNELTYDELKERFIIADWQLAKRQLTWLRRNSFVQWVSLSDAKTLLVSVLAKAR